ncbi:hypothetical protein [Evansella clarkii]|uniref:hypothetical protein n=1 Tax=Evansella clarkii TaxID=79879 RepID=UPI0009986AD4|nr:hypothetical protein [Evansella clarkii]
MMEKIYGKITETLSGTQEQFKKTMEEEKGALSLEWVAIGLLVIVFVTAIISVLGDDQQIGGKIIEVITGFLDNLNAS